MTTQGSVTRLVSDLRSGDLSVRNRAAQEIWVRYFRELLDLARTHLKQRIRRRVDEEDVLQSMYRSFCLRQERGQFDLANRDALWSLLVTITLNKARNAANAQGRRRRDIDREQTASGDDVARPTWRALEQMETGCPTPEEAALLNEALERRLQGLADSELRQIATWKIEGWTNAEIAGQLDYTTRTVERRLREIRRIWSSFDDGTL